MLWAVLLLGSLICHPQTKTGRYLYVVGCDALVDKLDTVADQKMAAYDLAKRTGKEQLIPAVTGTLDGCLAYQAVYDDKASVFYTIVPVEAQPKPDGTKDYRVLGFSVPELTLAKSMNGGENASDPPHLEAGKGQPVKVVTASEWRPQTELDLSTFAPDKKNIPNQILETSGEKVLLRIFTANRNELALAVADRKSKTLVRLQDTPSTFAPNVHLAPGGDDVLVEEALQSGSQVTKTGKLLLYSASTGKPIKELSGQHIQELYFLAISPTGKAIYHSSDKYSFIDLGKTFVPDVVTRPIPTGYPGLFFADK